MVYITGTSLESPILGGSLSTVNSQRLGQAALPILLMPQAIDLQVRP